MIKSKNKQLRDSAFTLVEMVMALGILAVLMLAGQSAIMVAGRTVPGSSSPTYSAGNGQRALDILSHELRYATGISSMTSTSVSFTVAARGSDSTAETITYSWDGIAGDPLTRQYNSDAAVNVVNSVNAFSLLYDKKTQVAPTTYSSSGTSTLYSYSSVVGLLSTALNVQNNMWLSESFTPSIPSNATTWSVTSVKFDADKGSPTPPAGAQCLVEIRPSSNGVPGTAIYQEATISPSTFGSSVAWQTVNFTNPVSIPAGVQGALTLQWVTGAGAVGVEYQFTLSSGLAMQESNNSGSSWNNMTGMSVYCVVYGTYTTPNPTTYNYYLENVRASLQVGSNSDAAVRTGIPVLNLPQVTGP